MNPEKVGKFIKEIRKKNNLTQKDLAEKYGVTYQAVSKWENGKNIPDISLIREMSKDFNISVEDILDGKFGDKKKKYNYFIIILIMIIIGLISYYVINSRKQTFDFKTISTTCEDFKVNGSIAYNDDKTSIYISSIDYCGEKDSTIYKYIECNLYEKDSKTNILISSYKRKSNITLYDYLKDIKLNIDNYDKVCKNYSNNSLYLEINAKDTNNKTITYRIPLKLNDNCK